MPEPPPDRAVVSHGLMMLQSGRDWWRMGRIGPAWWPGWELAFKEPFDYAEPPAYTLSFNEPFDYYGPPVYTLSFNEPFDD